MTLLDSWAKCTPFIAGMAILAAIQIVVSYIQSVYDLKVNGNVVTGQAIAAQGTADLGGSFANGRIKLEGKASMPFPITIGYDLTIRDGELTGDNTNGPFGTFPVRGTRQK